MAKGIKQKGTPSINVWRDTAEQSQLSERRAKKFKHDLSKYISVDKVKPWIVPHSWQGVYEQINKQPYDKKEYLASLGSMIQILLLGYDPPSGSTIDLPKKKNNGGDH